MGLKRNFSWMLLSRFILIATTLLTAGMINRALGASARGLYAEMQTWVTFFTVLFGLSMDTAIYHFANRERYGSDDSSRFITISLVSFLSALIAAACLMFFVYFWPKQVSPETYKLILYLDALLFITIIASNLTVFMQAIEKIRFAAIIGISQGIVNITIITYGFFFELINIAYVIESLVIVQSIALIMLLFASKRAGYLSGKFSGALAVGMVKAGLKQHIATVATFIYTKVNQLIVFKYCGASEAGSFAVALNLAIGFIFIPSTYQIALYPRIIHANDDYEITVKSVKFGFYMWGSAVLLIIFFANPLLLIYGGNEFVSAAPVFRILMIAACFLPLSSIVAPYCVKVGAFTACSMTAVILGIISIGFNFFLIPRYYGIGGAWATTITAVTGFCMAIGLLWYLRKA